MTDERDIVERLRAPEFADVAEKYLMWEASHEIERLRSEVDKLNSRAETAEAEPNKLHFFYEREMRKMGEVVYDVTAERDRLRQERDRLINAFRHRHIPGWTDGQRTDRCAKCGFDLRNNIHVRVKTDGGD